jgi:hypothetical protein
MHPIISYHLAQARIADLRHHAQQAALARAVRRARPGPRGQATPLLTALGRQVRPRPAPRTGQAPVAARGEAASC